jgi:hypothetical protein
MHGSWVILISIVTDYGLDDRGIGFRFLAGAEISFLSKSRSALRPAHPVSLPMDVWGSISGSKAGHSHLICCAGVKNAWIYTSFPPYVFIVWYLIEHRDIFKTLAYFSYFKK